MSSSVNLAATALAAALSVGCPAARDRPAGPAPNDGAVLLLDVEGTPELSGRFWTGDLICLPPARKITVRVLLPETGCRLVPEDATRWAQAGGTVAGTGTGRLRLFSPQPPGMAFRLQLSPMGGHQRTSPPPAGFRALILHEAEVARSRRTGRWRVRLAREFSHVYPNPEKAMSWRVRMHSAEYAPPRFWTELSAGNQNLQLAPNVRMGDMIGFITEKDKSKPKRRHARWFPPNRPLICKLEMLSRELRSRGVKFRRLAVNSAFRTPRYNRRVGGSSFSRHIYGDAVDVMIDEDGDEVCDDINGDAVVDDKDGLVIGQAIRRLENATRVRRGGIGVYGFEGKVSCRSYCHFDARGYVTRWGLARRHGKRSRLDWWPASEYREDEDPPPEFRDPPGKRAGKTGKP